MTWSAESVLWAALATWVIAPGCAIEQSALVPATPHDTGIDTASPLDSSVADSSNRDSSDSSVTPADSALDGSDSGDGAADAGPSPGFRSLNAGPRRTCAVDNAGRLFCWGRGAERGALGIGVYEDRAEPARVGVDSDWALVSVGTFHVCAIKQSGALYCFGAGASGRLGIGDTMNRLTPARVDTNTWLAVDAGDHHTCGVTFEGRMMCWGGNERGQLGISGGLATTPRQVGSLTDWVSVTAGLVHTCGSRTSAGALCWGANDRGQLGVGDRADRPAPTSIPGFWLRIDTLRDHVCGRGTDRSVYCWGANDNNALGLGIAVSGDRLVPTAVPTAALGTNLSVGERHACQLTDLGELQCWGSDLQGELGQGSTAPKREMVVVPVEGVRAHTAGRFHSCAADSVGILRCFGGNDRGQLGLGTVGGTNTTPAAVAFP